MPNPTPGRARPRRRINPDKTPFDRLPVIKADGPDGPIEVLRGELNIDDLTDAQRNDVQLMHNDRFVVFTNSFGQHQLAWSGQLIDPDLDLSRIGHLPVEDNLDLYLGFHPERADSLGYLVSVLRSRAQLLLDAAEKYQDLIDAGWEMNHDPSTKPYGNITNTGADGASFAPGPR